MLTTHMASTATTEDPRWTAVQARDWRADGDFVFAVATTGVYCRPSCPSRRPNRDNVRFFDSADGAEHAGFRPCQRCRPRESSSAPVRAIERARAWIDTHAEEPVTLDRLARIAGFSPFHFQRTFKRMTGLTPREYIAARRAVSLKTGLQAQPSVTDAIFAAGYGSSSRVYEQTNAHLGMPPRLYRRGAPGVRISYDVVGSPLGRLLVAATDRGLCRVAFGESDAALEADLAGEFPSAELNRSTADVAVWTAEVLRRVEGSKPRVDVPLDVRATAFQWQVWTALNRIPRGETRSYGAVAAAIGRPKATRAVARACASNPVAVVIPCHRVRREDGAVGGYRWGVSRKQRLLQSEGATGPARAAKARWSGRRPS
jgi:AraC family transcriptional regulator of adaptative response/methylated-DNA-[protein]-cysteine methyltransferase